MAKLELTEEQQKSLAIMTALGHLTLEDVKLMLHEQGFGVDAFEAATPILNKIDDLFIEAGLSRGEVIVAALALLMMNLTESAVAVRSETNSAS